MNAVDNDETTVPEVFAKDEQRYKQFYYVQLRSKS